MTEPTVSDLAQFRTAVRYQLRFFLRTYRFLTFLILTVILWGATLTVQLYYANPGAGTVSSYLSSSLTYVDLLMVLVAAFLGGDAIAMDLGSATGYYVLVQPVRRRVLLFGRYAAALGASMIILAVYYLAVVVGTLHFYGLGSVPTGLLDSFLLATWFTLAALAGAFLFSSFFKSPAVSMIATVLILFLGLDIAGGIASLSGTEPWFSLLYAGGAISGVMDPTFVHHTVVAVERFRISTWSAYPWEAAEIMFGYLVVGLGSAWAIYERRESRG
jgi:ABC-2 type transport system permease protein